MSLTVTDLLHDADLFRRAYPGWPGTEPVIDWGVPGPDRCDVPGGCGHLPGCPCSCCPDYQEVPRG